jgi:carbon storage regulator CsrA
MLVLSRKKGQELVIGDGIRVVINRVAGNRVTLGIVAPPEVSVVRGELSEAVNSFRDEPEARDEAPRSTPATAK